jgi:hypothetical protein
MANPLPHMALLMERRGYFSPNRCKRLVNYIHSLPQSITTLEFLACLAFACWADGVSQVVMLHHLKERL